MDKQLQILSHLPQEFFNITAPRIEGIIDRPTLIYLKGREKKPLFVSALLHGDEVSGLFILQKVLKQYQNTELPRDLIIFIGNPRACAKGVRHLETQLDFNRIWLEEDEALEGYEYSLAKQVLTYVKKHGAVTAVDIHNNSGRNPIYSCINKKEKKFVELGGLFSKNIIYFTRPATVLSKALSEICPAVVIECGLSGSKEGILTGCRFIETLLNTKSKENKPLKDLSIYHTRASLRIDPSSLVSFDAKPELLKNEHFCFTDKFDSFNFKKVSPGLNLGKVKEASRIRLINEEGKDIFNQFFSIEDQNLLVKTSFIPSMFTKNKHIAKSDCLGYIMEQAEVSEFSQDENF